MAPIPRPHATFHRTAALRWRTHFNKLPFVPDVPDVDGILLDQVIGEEDLPEPDTRYVGGDFGADVSFGAREDEGSSEVEASAKLRSALGGQVYTRGDRKGETELYYELTGTAGAELRKKLLGEGNAGVSEKVTVTLVIDKNGKPKTLKVNGFGTATGLNNLGDPDSGPMTPTCRSSHVTATSPAARPWSSAPSCR